MDVNSAYTDLPTNRAVAMSWIRIVPIAIGLFAILIVTFAFAKRPDPNLHAKQVNLLIREIGHRLLLQAGDSTSRVMPVTEVKKGTFRLRFENELVFNHDSLMVLTQDLLPKAQFPSGYTVTVHDCKGADIVYGFQVNNALPDILPCRGRSQPVGCYAVEFAFADFYEDAEQYNAQGAHLLKVDPKEVASNHEKEFSEKNTQHDIGKLTEQLKSFKADTHRAEPNPVGIGTKELTTANSDYPLSNLIYSGVLALLAGTLLIARFVKLFTVPTLQNQQEEIAPTTIPKLLTIGKFSFDLKNRRLWLEGEIISLTDKECRILELLNKSFGELISRETLMQEVWINEGVITGRSLDMFVSKLRKKLSGDPELRITNVHGKGYSLEIFEMNVS